METKSNPQIQNIPKKQNTKINKISHKTKMHNQRQSAIRIKHHIILRAELRFRKSFKDILQLGNPLLHELPSLLQIYRLPLMHRHPSPSPSSSPTTKRSNPSNSTPNRSKIKRSIKSKNTQRSKQSIGRMRKLT